MNDGCEKEVEVEDVQVRERGECLRGRFMNGTRWSEEKTKKICSHDQMHGHTDVPNKRST